MNIIEKAVLFATEAHIGMTRKGKDRPFILHPMEVMTIVAGLTDDEEVIAAAALHDVVEDTPIGPEVIEQEFGTRVRDLVMAESEDKMKHLPADVSWQLRKQATIDFLGNLRRDAKIICLGDKLSNIRSMTRDVASTGDRFWEIFNQKDKTMHRWYYSSILDVLAGEFGEIREIKEYRKLLNTLFADHPEQ